MAVRLLTEIEDEDLWDQRLQATRAEQWESMAALARRELEAGETVDLEEFLAAESSQA